MTTSHSPLKLLWTSPALLAEGELRVPEVTAMFWVTKALTTAMGESTSDYLVHVMPPVAAVLLGFVAFVVALRWQFRQQRYTARYYWLAVSMVGVFGTMVADVLHVGFGVPYTVSSPLFAIALTAIFITWRRTEHTLSIHSVNTGRREMFYWATVVATFALGTAVGDLTAVTINIRYGGSAVLFAVLILIPAVGFWRLRWNPIASFWASYVLTRPLGASVADYLGKPKHVGGLGFGDGRTALLLSALIVIAVSYLIASGGDRQGEPMIVEVEA